MCSLLDCFRSAYFGSLFYRSYRPKLMFHRRPLIGDKINSPCFTLCVFFVVEFLDTVACFL